MLAFVAIVVGLGLLLWGADRFVSGGAAAARIGGISPMVVGMVIIGFGTSVPEMLVSGLAAHSGNPGIALGNAYGSNITNIALILGVTALMRPIAVASSVIRQELPMLCGVTAVCILQLLDRSLSRWDAVGLLILFAILLAWTMGRSRQEADPLAAEVDDLLAAQPTSMKRALRDAFIGLAVLIGASRLLVWGAVVLAKSWGVSDMLIGLTIVAVGTSLPELASSIVAARRGENDLALGNILGSNLFNTLAVVGIAGVIQPMAIPTETIFRDLPVMAGLTVSLFLLGWGWRGKLGHINRWEGGLLLASYVAYTVWLMLTAT